MAPDWPRRPTTACESAQAATSEPSKQAEMSPIASTASSAAQLMMDKEAAHARGTSTGSTHDLSEKESVESVTDDVLLTLLTCHTEGVRRTGSPPHGELDMQVPSLRLVGEPCEEDIERMSTARTERMCMRTSPGPTHSWAHSCDADEPDRP